MRKTGSIGTDLQVKVEEEQSKENETGHADETIGFIMQGKSTEPPPVTTYTVTFDTDGNGTISGEAIQEIEENKATQEVTAVANEGYAFSKWSDEVADNPRTIDPVTADLTLTAIFLEDTTTPPDLPVIDGDILSQTFGLSNLNRRDAMTYGDGTTWAYEYDGKGNLESANKTHGTDPTKNLSFSYTYDDNGNRLTANEAGVSKTYTPNGLNQYDQVVVDGQAITIFYDEDGNPTTHKNWDLTWDAENRLSTMAHQTEDIILDFKYNFRGFRIRKKVTVNGSVDKHIAYIYDGNLVSAEIDIKDGTQKVNRRYTWGLDPAGTKQQVGGIGALVGMEAFEDGGSSKKYHVVSDAGGNVAKVLQSNDDHSLSIANSYEHDGFGKTLTKTENVEMPYGYNTKYTDSETDLVYYGFRYYDSANGRWLNQDPIGVSGGINVYNSVSNNMVNGFSGGQALSSGMEEYVGYNEISTNVDAYGLFSYEWIVPNVSPTYSPLHWKKFTDWTSKEKKAVTDSINKSGKRLTKLIAQIPIEINDIKKQMKKKGGNCCLEEKLISHLEELKKDLEELNDAINDSTGLNVHKSYFPVVKPSGTDNHTAAAYRPRSGGLSVFDDQMWFNTAESKIGAHQSFDVDVFHELLHFHRDIKDNRDGTPQSGWKSGDELQRLQNNDIKNWTIYKNARKFTNKKISEIKQLVKKNVHRYNFDQVIPYGEECLK